MDRHGLHDTDASPDNSMTEYQSGTQKAPPGDYAHQGGMSLAVLVPCHNEASAVAQVVQDFRRNLPTALIYVYDNASTDDTSQIARNSGAIVRAEPLLGKGNVVRRMFADIEADIYVMVDGDGTYDAAAAPGLVERLLRDGLDMVNCARVPAADSIYRPGHRFGNRILTGLVARVFGERVKDMLSGYRVMSRRFVKSFPALSTGFEIETEITVHALELRAPIAEMAAPYFVRPRGSASKLHTFADGIAGSPTHRAFDERGTPAAVFFSNIRHVDSGILGARHPGRAAVSRHWTCRSTADRSARDRPDDPGLPQSVLRPCARHDHAGAARNEKAQLPGHWPAAVVAEPAVSARSLIHDLFQRLGWDVQQDRIPEL